MRERYGELRDVKVGDRLTYNGGHQRPYEFRHVAKVMQTCVVDDKGSRWTIRGYPWGEGRDGFSRESVRPFREQDEVTNRELAARDRDDKARRRVRDLDWRALPMKQINAILAAAFAPEHEPQENV